MPNDSPKKEKGNRLWYKTALAVLPPLATWYMRLVFATSKKEFIHKDREEQICKKQAFIIASFHQTLVASAFHVKQYNPVVMVSRSWDGEFIARVVERWGFFTARGSSSHGGKEALAEMVELFQLHNCPPGITVDAPRGPAGTVKMGVVILGRETGLPVVPTASWATRVIQFKSWDKMVIPLPFSTLVFSFGKPTMVPQGLPREDYERLRVEIEENMKEADGEVKQRVHEIKQS